MRRRQVLALNGVSLTALTTGCTVLSEVAGDNDETTDDQTITTEERMNGNESDSNGSEVSEPTITRGFGECHGDHGLELTVFEPRYERVVSTSEGVLDLPDETGIAIAPIAFYNRTDERQGLFAPTFTLVSEGLTVEEQLDIPLGEEDRPEIKKDELFMIERDGRWDSHGTGINSEDSVTTMIVFEIPTDIETDGVHILFEPILGMENTFGDDVIAWGDT